jgi:hypothetical protein
MPEEITWQKYWITQVRTLSLALIIKLIYNVKRHRIQIDLAKEHNTTYIHKPVVTNLHVKYLAAHHIMLSTWVTHHIIVIIIIIILQHNWPLNVVYSSIIYIRELVK